MNYTKGRKVSGGVLAFQMVSLFQTPCNWPLGCATAPFPQVPEPSLLTLLAGCAPPDFSFPSLETKTLGRTAICQRSCRQHLQRMWTLLQKHTFSPCSEGHFELFTFRALLTLFNLCYHELHKYLLFLYPNIKLMMLNHLFPWRTANSTSTRLLKSIQNTQGKGKANQDNGIFMPVDFILP